MVKDHEKFELEVNEKHNDHDNNNNTNTVVRNCINILLTERSLILQG